MRMYHHLSFMVIRLLNSFRIHKQLISSDKERYLASGEFVDYMYRFEHT
jgi:hypothetical protein